MLRDEIGVAQYWVKDDPEPWALDPSEYERFKADWMAGKAFYTGKDIYGDEVVVRLSAVTVIHRGTPENMARHRAESKAARREESLE